MLYWYGIRFWPWPTPSIFIESLMTACLRFWGIISHLEIFTLFEFPFLAYTWVTYISLFVIYIFCIGLFAEYTPSIPEKSLKLFIQKANSPCIIFLAIFPCVTASLTSTSTFPSASGTIFLLLISNVIPARSSKLSISSSFVITSVPVCSCSCAEAILLCALIGKIPIATTKPMV